MSRTPTLARTVLRDSLRASETSHVRARYAHSARYASYTTISPIAGPSRSPHIRLSRSTQSSRRYATTLITDSPGTQPLPLPSKPKIRVTPPELERVKSEGFFDDDLQLIPEEEARIVISPEAITQLALITSREPPDTISKGKLALRIMVESGGCHGYQDTLSLTEDRNVDDYVFQPEGVNCIPVVIDLVSLNLLKGSTIHFATELIGSSFRIIDNPQAKDGGSCGCGVSWEAKL